MHDIQWARDNNIIVHAGYRALRNAETIIVMLAEHQIELEKRIMQLEMIAPRKIKVGEETYIWRCPDKLVPDL